MLGQIALLFAVIFEVIGTLLLPQTQSFRVLVPSIGCILSYLLSTAAAAIAVQSISVSIVYAIWAGLGLVLIVLFDWLFYQSALSLKVGSGLCLILIGVVLVQLNRV